MFSFVPFFSVPFSLKYTEIDDIKNCVTMDKWLHALPLILLVGLVLSFVLFFSISFYEMY